MQIKGRFDVLLRKDYPDAPRWKAFIYWWFAANGYSYDVHRDRVLFVDGANDGGIDAVAWPLEHQGHDEIVVLQSKYFGQPLAQKDLDRFEEAVAALTGPLSRFQGWLDSCRDELHPHYRRLREQRRRCRFVAIAPCDMGSRNKNWYRKRKILLHDAGELRNLERNYSEGRTPRLDEIRLTVASPPQKVAEQSGTAVFVFTVAARELGRAFEKHGNVLFAGNIRYALRGTTARRVRSGILETLKDHPHEMVFFP